MLWQIISLRLKVKKKSTEWGWREEKVLNYTRWLWAPIKWGSVQTMWARWTWSSAERQWNWDFKGTPGGMQGTKSGEEKKKAIEKVVIWVHYERNGGWSLFKAHLRGVFFPFSTGTVAEHHQGMPGGGKYTRMCICKCVFFQIHQMWSLFIVMLSNIFLYSCIFF